MQTDIDKAIAISSSRGYVSGRWELDREKPSLGGLLILRAELECLAAKARVDRIRVSFCGVPEEVARARAQSLLAVLRSRFTISLDDAPPPDWSWPPRSQVEEPVFSYQAFDRCVQLYRATGVRPRLVWDNDTVLAATACRNETTGRMITAHLKRALGGTAEESNADLEAWRVFLSDAASPGHQEFLLIGDDAISDAIRALPGVRLAREQDVPLPVQLALVSLSDGFIGMASGPCTSAVLSNIPYVIFKHPLHHSVAMKRELGSADAFEFSLPRQRLWRRRDTPIELARALQFVSDSYRE